MEKEVTPFQSIRDLPPLTVEYFCKVYVKGAEKINGYKAQCSFLESPLLENKVLEIYNDIFSEVEAKRGLYDFYIQEKSQKTRLKVSEEVVKAELEKQELFGLAVYAILLETGSLEMGERTYYVVKKSQIDRKS